MCFLPLVPAWAIRAAPQMELVLSGAIVASFAEVFDQSWAFLLRRNFIRSPNLT
jgi:hypothetical protein